MADETAEIKSGVATLTVRSIIKTSNTNRTPAIGALNTPAMAPAAPHPRRIMTYLVFILKNLAMLEAIALPVKTIGASNPTLPPKATVIEEVNIELQQ